MKCLTPASERSGQAGGDADRRLPPVCDYSADGAYVVPCACAPLLASQRNDLRNNAGQVLTKACVRAAQFESVVPYGG
jgi:hypothetical protein